MRGASLCCEAHENGGHDIGNPPLHEKEQQELTNRESSGPMSKVRRFFHLSLNDRANIASAVSEGNVQTDCLTCTPENDHGKRSQIVAFRIEAENVIGRPLHDLMTLGMGGRGKGEGVPALVHALCDHMLDFGIDYETLLSENWHAEEMRAAIVGVSFNCEGDEPDFKELKTFCQSQSIESTLTAALLRLFLEDLPQPLLDRYVFKDLKNILKDYGQLVDVYDRAIRLLENRLSDHNLQLLRYLCEFLNSAAKQRGQCSSQPRCLSKLLARVISGEGTDSFEYDGPKSSSNIPSSCAIFVAEILIRNHDLIFNFKEEDGAYSSDSPSSPGESPAGPIESSVIDPEDESTSTTTDTDDFRSPPVSPTKGVLKSSGQHDKGRATAELPDADGFRTKKSNFGKSYLPSITDLLSSPDESCLKDEVQRSTRPEHKDRYENQFVSDGSSGAEEADSNSLMGTPCPHEERRSSERFSFGKSTGRASSEQGKKVKKTRKRKHSKERSHRLQSSGDDDEDLNRGETFTCLLDDSSSETPQPFDPTPASDPVNLTISSLSGEADLSETSTEGKWVTDLLSSNEPVTSDRSWGLGSEASMHDEFDDYRRTARHYSREDDDSTTPSQYYSTARKKSQDSEGIKNPQAAIKLLQKNVSSIKKKIKKFEEEFESAFGYRPSHSEKMKHKDVKKYISELSKTRKELKQTKEDVSSMMNSQAITGFPMSFLRSQEPTIPAPPSPVTPGGAKDTLRQVLEHLHDKRRDSHRPEDLIDMSVDEVHDEKTSLQRALLYYESMHGRPSTKEERDLARPLYDRYRQVKRTIVRTTSRTKESLIELAPILEHEAMDFTLASPRHRGSLQDGNDEQSPVQSPMNQDTLPSFSPRETYQSQDSLEEPESPEPSSSGIPSPRTPINLGDLHALPIHELKERKREARDEKKRLRRVLREFEESFESQNGRKLQKEDRGPMEGSYAEYKHAKAKLRLLEALLSKHDTIRI